MSENVKKDNIRDIMAEDYMRYSMHTIKNRALINVIDNLKPIYRRILYSAYHSGARDGFIKSAKLVGRILGDYHPHGDDTIYHSIVAMTQMFKMNHPYFVGQGNFGSIDGDPPAAQRYTKVKLSEFAKDVYFDHLDVLPYKDNYDGTKKEPKVLCPKIPVSYLNGVKGTAVGYASQIPPHNLNELIDLMLRHLNGDRITESRMLDCIKAPDFPTGGVVEDNGGLYRGLNTGRGSVIVKPKYHFEKLEYGKHSIILDELPYRTNKSRLMRVLAKGVGDGRLNDITDIIDESDRDGVRVNIVIKQGSNPKEVIQNIIKSGIGRLEYQYNYTVICLSNGEPKRLGILDILGMFTQYRKAIMLKSIRNKSCEIRDEINTIKGRIIGIKNAQEIDRLITESNNVEELKNKLEGLTHHPVRIEAILNMNCETRMKDVGELENDIVKLERSQKDINYKHKHLDMYMKDELKDLKYKYGRPRRTEVE